MCWRKGLARVCLPPLQQGQGLSRLTDHALPARLAPFSHAFGSRVLGPNPSGMHVVVCGKDGGLIDATAEVGSAVGQCGLLRKQRVRQLPSFATLAGGGDWPAPSGRPPPADSRQAQAGRQWGALANGAGASMYSEASTAGVSSAYPGLSAYREAGGYGAGPQPWAGQPLVRPSSAERPVLSAAGSSQGVSERGQGKPPGSLSGGDSRQLWSMVSQMEQGLRLDSEHQVNARTEWTGSHRRAICAPGSGCQETDGHILHACASCSREATKWRSVCLSICLSGMRRSVGTLVWRCTSRCLSVCLSAHASTVDPSAHWCGAARLAVCLSAHASIR
jgi:hypothetical protein